MTFDCVTVSARAQWIVYDSANTVQSVINTAQEIAKYIEMINNQGAANPNAHRPTQRVTHYESLFGDPKTVVLTSAQRTTFARPNSATLLIALEGAVEAGEAMLYDANGLFTSVAQP